MRPLLLVLVLLAAPVASAAVQEFPLGPDMRPLALLAADDGPVWVTLEGPWAVGRFDPATGNLTQVPLAAPPADTRDSLFALRRAPDGSLWTASQTHLHRVDPGTLAAEAFPLPEPHSRLSGDVAFAPDGSVWTTGVSTERLVRLDPGTGRTQAFPIEAKPFGPLEFHALPPPTLLPHEVMVTGTYGNAVARVDLTDGSLAVLDGVAVAGPVGLAHHARTLWVAEMGASSVARVDPATGAVTRFPTTPSPYYPISGPTGILVEPDADGDAVVWFGEHFADRVARLDVDTMTLVEYEVPSAPGTNLQHVARAPDGAVWTAEWSTGRLARITYGGETSDLVLPERVALPAGGTARFDATIPGEINTSATHAGLRGGRAPDGLLVAAQDVPPGEHLLLVSRTLGNVTVGKYVRVTVEPTSGPAATPGPAPVGAALAAALAGVASRRWRR